MEEASGVLRNEARNATGTGGRKPQELCGVCGNVWNIRDALHRHANEHTRHTAHICRACDQSSLKNSKFVEHCPNNTGKNRKCETCGELFHLADHLSEHYHPSTDEGLYRCERAAQGIVSTFLAVSSGSRMRHSCLATLSSTAYPWTCANSEEHSAPMGCFIFNKHRQCCGLLWWVGLWGGGEVRL
ncbi:uncharacterized protein LOC142560833 [Dermacentor variabilis]|uniref:uncharacterized protein LOC142560833 n=1 Tax=Dermacentor variabilis TaxID=34621 RepID=UPI003F5CA67B